MKISKSTTTILIVLIAVGLIYGIRFLKNSGQGVLKKQAMSRVQGNPKAPLHIIEYIDFECGACASGFRILKDYMNKFPSKIYLEIRYYPIARIHPYAIKSAMYVECAARQNKFWPFFDLLMEKQSQWSRLLNADRMFRELATQANVDLNKLAPCIEDEKVKSFILDEKANAKTLGVDATPTYFINGKMVVGPKLLEEEINHYLGGQAN